MKFSSLFSVALSALVSNVGVKADGDILQIHGSGTTNPSVCLWQIMQDFEERMKLPARFTYRAVGSSTGQFEFMGVNNTGNFAYQPWNYFGSGDIPFSKENYDLMNQNGKEFYQLPFVMGAISVFHNIPGVDSGPDGLRLTPCVLAKIFRRQIQYWDDPEVIDLNPQIEDVLKEKKLPIKVARRVLGSSSTATFTQYLHESTQIDCPDVWPKETSSGDVLVGKVIDWAEDTLECQGSGGVTKCINDNEGGIGYLDSGHGHDQGLTEIELRNIAGTYQSSREASEAGIAAAAGETLPEVADADFSVVQLLNQPGAQTWPMVAMSYIYLRKDLSFIDNDVEKSLLLAFIEGLYDPDIIGECRAYGFVPVSKTVSDMAKAAIQEVRDTLNSSLSPAWVYEVDTIKGGGQNDYVISKKRRTYGEWERSNLVEDTAALMLQSKQLAMEQSMVSKSGVEANTDGLTYTQDDADRITAALAMGGISIVLWALTVITLLVRKLCCK